MSALEIVVPAGGLGQRLDTMYGWHRGRGIEVHRGSGRRVESRDIIRWCFADVKTAADELGRWSVHLWPGAAGGRSRSA